MSIIFVHGLWGNALHWANTVLELTKAGHKSTLHPVDIPLESLAADAERVRKAIETAEEPVLLVGHSYGGAVITEAGNHPKVKGLVYIAAFGPDAGQVPGELHKAALPYVQADAQGYIWVERERFHELFCKDLPADEAWAMSVGQHAPLAGTIQGTITQAAWKEKPSWYQVSTQDLMIEPDAERATAKRIGAKKTIELDASHATLASRPKEVAALILEAATEIGISPK